MISKSSARHIRSLSVMLKPRLIAAELLKKRVEDKAKDKRLLILNSADLQVIGGQYQGFYPSLLVNSEGNSYLFNCGSGTQRYCYTNKVKVAKIENVFVTNRSWSQIAGIYGLALTLQDVGCPRIRVHSTEGIDGLFDATNSFMTFNTGMERVTRTNLEGEYLDSGLKVIPIVLDSETYTNADVIDSADEDLQSNKRLKVRPKLVAYLCYLPDLPGALDPVKCKELKVPLGRHLAILKSGTDIQIDGRTIKSTDVCGPKNIGLKFLVIECPSLNHIEILKNNEVLNDIIGRRKSNGDREVEMVIHFSPKNVVENQSYQEWYHGFADECRHLLLNDVQAKKLLFSDCYQFQYLMGKLDNELFPDLNLPPELLESVKDKLGTSLRNLDDSIPALVEQNTPVKMSNLEELDKVIKIRPLDRIFIRPRRQIEESAEDLPIDCLFEDAKLDSSFNEELANLKSLQSNLPKHREFEPEVVFLGTGSALPSKLRNTSCILLNFYYPTKASVIMDCGEDSLGQLIRFYGGVKSDEILKQLKMIYISHHHADHQIGLIDLLSRRKLLTKDPVVILAPPGIDTLLDYYDLNFEDLSGSYQFYSTRTLRLECTPGSQGPSKPSLTVQSLYERLPDLLEHVDIVGVKHCIDSCAVAFRFKIQHPDMETFKISYSGDARPSSEFVRIGLNSDLLIHEATFDDKCQEDAILKKHSTSTEAIKIGKQMNAKFTILTHFSARFSKIPHLTEHFDDSVGFAFDNLRLRCPSHYARLPMMKPILRTVFRKSIDELEMKYQKQDLKQQTISNMIKERKN